ncbi:MAG: AAA family ATPase, partial [Venatoribacter sp.]
MYLDYFGFSQLPFTIAPNPELLYFSKSHQEAYAHLQYALTGQGGLVCLTGEVGTGKTTLCRAFLESLPAGTRSAYIFNPQLSPIELLQSLAEELGIQTYGNKSLRELYSLLNHELLAGYAKGERFICVIDEAQSMPVPLLEQVRLLTNLETNQEKLLTLILIGQPELQSVLQRYELRQLNQRITARFHLPHLSLVDTGKYLKERCRLAGNRRTLFTGLAVLAIWQASKGIPRLINVIADRALLGAYSRNKKQVGVALVHSAQKEVGSGFKSKRKLVYASLMLVAAAAAIKLGSNLNWPEPLQQAQPVMAEPAKPSAALLLSQALHLPSSNECHDVLQYGWQCLALNWSLSQLQRVNAPAVIYANTPQGVRWALLSELQADWGYLNKAMVLWQPPAGFSNKLVRPNDTDEVVAWVRLKLNMQWQDSWRSIGSKAPDPNFYDLLLAQKVAEFQKENAVIADRVLGPQTLF